MSDFLGDGDFLFKTLAYNLKDKESKQSVGFQLI